MSKRAWYWATTCAILSVAAAIGALSWKTVPAPRLPQHLAAADPEIVNLIETTAAAINEDRENPARWLKLGMVYEANDFPELAEESYLQSIQLGHRSARGWYRLALVRSQIGDIDGAIESIHEAIAIGQDYPPLLRRLGLWHLDRGEPRQASTAFAQAVELSPTDVLSRVGLARSYLALGEPHRASELLENIVRTQPRIPYVHLLLGRAYALQGRPEDATRETMLGDGTPPSWEDEWAMEVNEYRTGFAYKLKRAYQLSASGHWREAIKIQEALRVGNPSNVALLNNLGKDYMQTGRSNDGLNTFRAALEQDPSFGGTHQNLALAYHNVGRDTLALQHADRAIALNPKLPRGFEIKALVQMRNKHFQAALELLETAQQLGSNNADLRLWKGLVLCDLARCDEGVQELTIATEERPTRIEPWLALAQISTAERDRPLAHRALQAAISLDANDSRVKFAKRRFEQRFGQLEIDE